MNNLTLKSAISQATSSTGIRAGTNQDKFNRWIAEGNVSIADNGETITVNLDFDGHASEHEIDKNLLCAVALMDTLGAVSISTAQKTLKIWAENAINSFALTMAGKTIATKQDKVDLLDYESVKRSVYTRPSLATLLDAVEQHPEIESLLIDEAGKQLLEQSKQAIEAAQGAINELASMIAHIKTKKSQIVSNNGTIIKVSMPVAEVSGFLTNLSTSGLQMLGQPNFSADFSSAELELTRLSV